MLFVGEDWAEDHHDVEIQDHDGRRLTTARIDEGVTGVARLHALIAAHAGDLDPDQVLIGIETDRGLWVAGAGRRPAIGCSRSTRARPPGFRERHSVSGAKSDSAECTCWLTWSARMPTSCAWWLVTVTWSRRSRCGPRAPDADLGAGPAGAAAARAAAGVLTPRPWSRSRT